MDSQTDNHILIDKRRLSSVLDMPFFRGADCDTDHHLVVAKVRERFAVSKHRTQNFDVERFNLCRLSELEFRKQYQINPLNAELNPICHLPALLGALLIFHVSGLRVKISNRGFSFRELK